MPLRVASARTLFAPPQSMQSNTRSLVTPLAGGLVVYAAPGSPMNKGIGIAITEPLEEAPLAAVEEEWRDRNEPMRIELSALAKPEAATLLTARGYRLIGFENQLGCALADGDCPHIRCSVGTVPGSGLRTPAPGGNHRRDSCRVRREALARCHGRRLCARRTPRRPHTRSSRARCWTTSSPRSDARADFDVMSRGSMDKSPAPRACGSMGTSLSLLARPRLPAFRRCGVQTALLRHRLLEARERGCTLAVVTTQPGSTSQANVQRRGFTVLYTRAILVRSW